ncbi:MAG: serine hydrolase domain-containing protein [Pseudomonadota bacterium]
MNLTDRTAKALLAATFVCGLATASGCSHGESSSEPLSRGHPDCFSYTHHAHSEHHKGAHQALTRLKLRVPDWLSQQDVPSVAVTYISEGTLNWTLVCGEQQPGIRASETTLYNTASMAKPMVGEIVLRAASRGLVTLDEPMARHWTDPDIENDPRRMWLTPRIAMAHQTGFKNWRRLSDGRLAFQWDPGTQTAYSGEGVRYVVRFLENKLGTPFEDIAQDLLFDSAGMGNTSFVGKRWFGERVAWRKLGNGAWAEPEINDEPLGAGDVWTTSEDYARFVVATLRSRDVSADMIAERQSIARDEASRWCGPGKAPMDVCPHEMGFSVGWYVYDYADHQLLAHNGSNEGEKTLAILVPELEIGFAIFTNGENGKAVIGSIARSLYDNPDFFQLEGY